MNRLANRLSGVTGLLALLLGSPALADSARMQRMAGMLGVDGGAAFTGQSQTATDTVERLVERALATHPGLKAERARVAARLSGVDVAKSAYHPKAGLTAQAGNAWTRVPGEDEEARTRSQSVGANVRQNLWRGGQDAKEIEIARQEAELAELARDGKAQELAYAVRSAALFYNQSALQQALAEEAAKDAEEFRRLSDRKFGAGQVGRIDVHTASMRESEAKAQAAKAVVTTRDAYFSLLKSLGADAEPEQALAQELSALGRAALAFPPAPPALPAAAPSTLSEKSAALSQTKSELTLDSAYRSRWLPEVDLLAGATREKKATRTDLATTEDRALRYDLGVELTWPLWARPKDHLIAEATHERDAAGAKAVEARGAARMEALALRARIEDLYRTLPLHKEAYVEAGRLYDAQLKLYEAGAIAVFVVTDADGQRLRSLRDWSDAVYQIKLALLRWQALEKGYVPPGG